MNVSREIDNLLTTAILLFDTKGRCEYANEAAQGLLQKGASTFTSKTIGDIFPLNPVISAQCEQALLRQASVVLREIEVHLPQWQSSLLLDLVVTPRSTESNRGLLLELIDRKDVAKLAHDAETAARFSTATHIIRGLSHEIKNPLGGIRGAAQLLSLEADQAELREYAEVITHEVDRLTALLDRMSSGGALGTPTSIDVHQLIVQVVNLLKAEFGDSVIFNFDFDTSLPWISVDAEAVQQALLNLFKNAAQWSIFAAPEKSQDGGEVRLKTRTAFPDPRRTSMPQQGMRIQIQDNGPGVEASIINQLYMPLVSCREGGTGLGLSISQQIARHHGGFIELDESQNCSGASFSLYLPYQTDARA